MGVEIIGGLGGGTFQDAWSYLKFLEQIWPSFNDPFDGYWMNETTDDPTLCRISWLAVGFFSYHHDYCYDYDYDYYAAVVVVACFF